MLCTLGVDAIAFFLPILYAAYMGNASSTTTQEGNSLPKTALDAVKGVDLKGKTFLVTGAYSGLGVATTKALLSAGGKVIVAGRNTQLQQDFVNELTTTDKILHELVDGSHTIDLSDLESVKDFALYVKKTYPTIDCLILNAGVMATPPGKTKQGLEVQFGVNVVGHFLLCQILAKQTKRQVWVSSRGHSMYKAPPPTFDNEKAPALDIDAIENVDESSYDGWMRYQQSKLGNVLLAKQFHKVYPEMEAVCTHPGLVATNLMRNQSAISLVAFKVLLALQGRSAQTPEQGARTQTYCAVLPSEELVNGGYYGYCKIEEEAVVAKKMDDAAALFDYCDKVTKPYQQE